ncbi:hypothetical protein EMIHUDRAFT_246583 [Emiliania huxleyi CCMP1516]|uniref:Uncharacterized protein n=2 Tax=Emiliania huxleyi TaxID=2903 RepID=A0A0D3IRQ1_EMIH1|nr:hypothetical protein EMIHUDRAFT_246583 [Emiliania huxleyi CCMP1516]EOD13936.1 hypothetical protein EMIHUDRAFT_246583 [Emiliania huxleyi CCMP1516]|eukprot:XP_005766365.1 hypothetical protein EMIHUDRAFT_246583 [Emiliania huxleyi CCMP1516]
MVQRVSRGGDTNRLSTAFVREDDQAEVAERTAFEAWLASVHGGCRADALSPFEHNLEVWRQLWRVVERSDVVCIVADVRNPLLHVPAALYEHCAARPSLRLVIVLSKVASVSRTPGHTKHLQTWELTPHLTICASPGLVFPVAGVRVHGVVRVLQLFPIAQVREALSAVRLLWLALDLPRMYNMRPAEPCDDEDELSPFGFCAALAKRKGYHRRYRRPRSLPSPRRQAARQTLPARQRRRAADAVASYMLPLAAAAARAGCVPCEGSHIEVPMKREDQTRRSAGSLVGERILTKER